MTCHELGFVLFFFIKEKQTKNKNKKERGNLFLLCLQTQGNTYQWFRTENKQPMVIGHDASYTQMPQASEQTTNYAKLT